MNINSKSDDDSQELVAYFKIGGAFLAASMVSFIAKLCFGSNFFMFIAAALLTIGFGVGILIPSFVRIATFLGYYDDK